MNDGQSRPVAAQATDKGLFTFYNAIFEERGFVCPMHLVPIIKALADTRIRKLMIIIGPGMGKSLLLSVAFPAWCLGIDPTLTILGVSGGEALIQGFMLAVAKIIEWSPIWRAVFPHVTPDKAGGWSTERGYFVKGRRLGDPDANYWGAGLDSASLTGKHGRLLIFDDIHNKDNSATIVQCEKVVNTYYNTLLGRQDPAGARMIIAGRRFHEHDIYGHLQEQGEFVVMTLPAERQGSKRLWFDITVPEGLQCVFTERGVTAG